MKFSAIKETDDNYSPKVKEYLKYIEMIRKDCKPFLDREKSLLYRGLGVESDLFLEKTVRTDRKPKDTHPAMSKLFDNIFYELFRVKLRSEALFAIRNMSGAAEYGNVYMIFPKGKYEIFVSSSISDLYSDVAGRGLFNYLLEDSSKKDLMDLGSNKEEKEAIGLLFDMFENQNTQDVLRNLSDVHTDFKSAANKLIEFIEMSVKEIIKDSYERDDGSNKRNELMVAMYDNDKKYYAVDLSTIRKKVPAQDREVLNGSTTDLLTYIEVNLKNGIWSYM